MDLVYVAKHLDTLIKVYADNADWLVLSEGGEVNFKQVWRTKHSTINALESFELAIDDAFSVNGFKKDLIEVVKEFSL